MSVKGEIISCSYCEGTGKELNHFDPPVTEYRKPMTILEIQRTISGREILEEPCPACNGTKKIVVIK
ncbi:hypothetical protein [Bacillus toyonensis]|uniref:hypothetical protein n=1 Tax=Bacillus toyonensis TaxID=155322 RepID=UPI000BF57980|nr:hypothetical protein [Bacillus toyonensis]PEU35483.1 hypothetical protein CN537_25000 [Bacillus toyonensis]